MNFLTASTQKDQKNLRTGKQMRYRFFVSAFAGVLCFFLSRYSFSVTIDEAVISIPWSLVFPFVIVLAYGLRYGLIAAFFGGAYYPFYLWESNGWGNVLSAIYLLVLFAVVGFYSDYRLRKRTMGHLLWVLLTLNVFYILFLYVSYVYIFNLLLAINPPFWINDTVNSYPKSILISFFVKNILTLSLILLFSESLLRTKEIRKLLRLPVHFWMNKNSKVFLLSVFVTFLVWAVIVVLDHFLLSNNQGMDKKYHAISFMVLFWSGGILGRILIWFQEISLKARDELVVEKNKLKENELKLRALYDNAPDMYVSVSFVDTSIILCNNTFLKKTGYQRSEIIGTNIFQLYHKDCQKEAEEDFQNFLGTGVIKNRELQLQNKDGSALEVSLNINTVKAVSGKVLYLMISWRDNTEHIKADKTLKQSEENFRLLVNNTFDGILIADSDGDYLYANKKAAEITGYSVDELIHTNTKQLTPERYLDEVQQRIEKQFSQNELFSNYEATLINKSGKEVQIEIAASLTTWKGIQTQIISFRDVTKRKKAEQELIKAKQKAEESDRLKSAFLANMSHEIRPPMNGIMGFTSLLKEPDLSGSEQQEYVEIIQKSGDRLLNTVNDIIEISKIETGQVHMQFKSINIIEQLEDLVAFFTPEANDKSIQLFFEQDVAREEAIFKTDVSKFNSIVTNLLKNALKFTLKGFVKLRCRLNSSTIEISVSDTGIGIPKERQQAIFNRFEQADVEDVNVFEGSGLGLSITKSYIEMLGGNISLESEPAKGSTFCVVLPILSKSAEEIDRNIKSSDMSDKPKKDLTILIAEDDELSYVYLSVLLKGFAREIIWAKTGLETIDLVQHNSKIDLVLMDMKMPKLSGFDATAKIRTFNQDVIIIAQTAIALEGDREKSVNAGCNDFISKPIDKKKLIDLIVKYCAITVPD